MSLVDTYKEVCTELSVKPNSAFIKEITGKDASEITSLDFSGTNMVGTKGAKAVAVFVERHLPNVTEINFSGNNLGSQVTTDFYNAFVKHENLTSLDVSNNDIRLGGPSLVDLVKKNKKITTLNIEGTFLRPLFERLIALHLKNNNEAAGKAPKARFAAFGGDGDAANGGEAAPEEEGGFCAFGEEGGHVAFNTGAEQGGGKKVNRRPTVKPQALTEEEIDNFEPEVIEKDEKTRLWLFTVLERHQLFSHLEDFELYQAVDAMQDTERGEGECLFEEGDEEGELFYILGNGEIDLMRGDDIVRTMKKGDTCGETMLMYEDTYKETAKITQDSIIFMMDRRTYKCILSKASKKKRALYEGFLSEVGFLKGLDKHELLQLADALKPVHFENGQKLIQYGSTGEAFFLIVDGKVDVYGRDDNNESKYVCSFTNGENVGELEFIHNHKCVADVVANGPLRAAKMNRRHFEMVMGPIKDILARTAATSEVYTYYREQLQKMEQSQASGEKNELLHEEEEKKDEEEAA